ncbi:MAG: VOC family protein, partial [Sphingobacteriaceae bacterium]
MKNTSFITVFSVFAALFLWQNTVSAQVSPTVDHITVYVVDLQKSADFYKKVMLLKEIPEPFHDQRHVWLRIGAHTQLHIVKGAKEIAKRDINIHLAFTVPVIEDFAAHLDKMNIKYGNWKGDSKSP